MCQGWLEGYLLTGRHGFFSCYEAFIHIIDSMVNQHAKWLKVTRQIPWRKPIASLNYLLSSLVWRQDHNGFSHQDPGFIDHLLNKKADVVRIYLPPDANTLLSVADHCLRSRNYINLIVAGKQPAPQWLTMDEAVAHCTTGLGVWPWASNDEGHPDVVMACCGDVPTMEALAAVTLLRARNPDIRIRVVNVVDLMALQPQSEHPHGLPDEDFDQLFPVGVPVIFAFHGYPWVIHRLTYRRHNHDNIHVRGYKEEGTTTTPFDMCVLNNIDRFQLTLDAITRVPRLAGAGRCGTAVVLRRDSAAQVVCGRKRRRLARDSKLALARGASALKCNLNEQGVSFMSSLPVLVLNSGSSSIKFSVYEAGDGARTKLHEGAVDGIGTDLGKFWIKDASREKAGGSNAGSADARRRIQAGCRRAALRRLPCSCCHRPSHGLRRADRAGESTHHARADRRDGALYGVRAAAHAHRRLHHARGAAAVSGHPEFRHSRHLLSSHHAGSRKAHADSRGVCGDGRAPLRSARDLVRIDRVSVASRTCRRS